MAESSLQTLLKFELASIEKQDLVYKIIQILERIGIVLYEQFLRITPEELEYKLRGQWDASEDIINAILYVQKTQTIGSGDNNDSEYSYNNDNDLALSVHSAAPPSQRSRGWQQSIPFLGRFVKAVPRQQPQQYQPYTTVQSQTQLPPPIQQLHVPKKVSFLSPRTSTAGNNNRSSGQFNWTPPSLQQPQQQQRPQYGQQQSQQPQVANVNPWSASAHTSNPFARNVPFLNLSQVNPGSGLSSGTSGGYSTGLSSGSAWTQSQQSQQPSSVWTPGQYPSTQSQPQFQQTSQTQYPSSQYPSSQLPPQVQVPFQNPQQQSTTFGQVFQGQGQGVGQGGWGSIFRRTEYNANSGEWVKDAIEFEFSKLDGSGSGGLDIVSFKEYEQILDSIVEYLYRLEGGPNVNVNINVKYQQFIERTRERLVDKENQLKERSRSGVTDEYAQILNP